MNIAEEDLMLTTVDNPFSPFTQYVQWRSWDTLNGYHTEEYLSRITDVPDDVDMDDDITINKLTNDAIQEILEHDMFGVYVLVSE